MNIAVILAAGSGTRLGGEKPKQFLTVCGKTILEHTVEAFHRHPDIDEIAIVTRTDYVDEVRRLTAHYEKVRHVVEGGKERYHSTIAALNLYTDDNDVLLFHDCVRPLVSQRIISDCIAALQQHDAIGVGVPTTDTIWQTEVDIDSNSDSINRIIESSSYRENEKAKAPNRRIVSIPPRSTLYNAQTPQGFRRATIRRAYDLALADPSFVSTDDCGVVCRYLPSTPIYIVQGDPTNIKITYREDLRQAEAILSQSSDRLG